MFFFTTSFNLVIPEMNAFISELGGAHLKGLIIGLFTISAGLSRPFSGKLTDYIGRKKTMFIGIVIALAVSLSYSLVHTVWLLLLLRFLHGFCQGFYPTGATALVTDLLPETKRGFGMGVWGTFISLGIGTGQGLSTLIVDISGKTGLFITSGLFVLIAALLYFRVKETLIHPQRFKPSMLRISKDEILEKQVIPVAIVMFLSAICSGIIFVLTPDMSHLHGIHNKGIFFLFYVLSTIIVRLLTGKISDNYGRRQTLLVGMSLLVVAMLVIGFSNSGNMYIFGSVLFGLATGVCSPTLFAWTADLSPEERRGIGAGTMFIALEFGILAGSLLTNLLYQNQRANVPLVFSVGALSATGAILYILWHLRFRKSPH